MKKSIIALLSVCILSVKSFALNMGHVVAFNVGVIASSPSTPNTMTREEELAFFLIFLGTFICAGIFFLLRKLYYVYNPPKKEKEWKGHQGY